MPSRPYFLIQMIRTPQVETRLCDAPLPAAIPLGYAGPAGIK